MTRMPSDDDIEALRRALAQQADTISQLTARLDAHAPLNSALSPNFPHGKPLFAFREIHNLSRQSIDSTHSVTFTIDYDKYISKLFNAKLQVRFSNVRSNVSAATGAAGGGTTVTSTSGGGSTPTSSSGGGQTPTSSSGGSSTPTSSSGGSASGSDISDSNLASDTPSTASTGLQSASHTHNETGSVTGIDNSNHDHSLSSHTHLVFGHLIANGLGQQIWQPDGIGDLSLSGHTHTVTISAHTHTVTVTDHTHTVTISAHTHDVVLTNHTHSVTLTYGIFEQAYSNPGLSVSINGTDRTAALGGPWNAGPLELDITNYLRETSGDPVRGTIPIVFTVAASLLDIEATLKSIVFGSDLVQAGV